MNMKTKSNESMTGMVILTCLILTLANCRSELEIKSRYRDAMSTRKDFHSIILNGIKIDTTIERISGFWLKTVSKEGQAPQIFFKTEDISSWKVLSTSCMIQELKWVFSKPGSCEEGWEMGRSLARTITFLAIHQGREQPITTNKNPSVILSIRQIIENTASCLKDGLGGLRDSLKKVCMLKGLLLESEGMIRRISEGKSLEEAGFSYEDLKNGKYSQ